MNKGIIRPGGPHSIKKTGRDEYSMSITIPADPDGYMARECTNSECSPGYFKVKPGTGITGDHKKAYCPYCRATAEPDQFVSKEQLRYAKDVAINEAQKGINRLVKDTFKLGSSGKRRQDFGFFSMEYKYKPTRIKRPRRPFEDEVRRDVTCPHCGLDQTVFGLAIWCADCGEDIFLSHVHREFAVIESMILDTERRREVLGKRVAAKDIENALEDIVSIQEAVLKVIANRYLHAEHSEDSEIDSTMRKIGTSFQNLERTHKAIQKHLMVDLNDIWDEKHRNELDTIMQKRHPITHNLGVMDKKYLDSVQSSQRIGREVLVREDELIRGIELSKSLIDTLYSKLFAIG